MNKIFAPFLPPWAETGLQPAFYDVESGTVLQQTARMYAKVQQLTRLFNELSEETKATVEEYIAKFVELKEFVEDYFDNLDVQEEINNKLDAMADDGTLLTIIGGNLGFVTPKMFGAESGTEEDQSEAIIACLDYCFENGIKDVYLNGDYFVDSTIAYSNKGNIKIKNGIIRVHETTAKLADSFKVLSFTNCNNIKIENVKVIETEPEARDRNLYTGGFFFKGSTDCIVSGCYFENTYSGIIFKDNCKGCIAENNEILVNYHSSQFASSAILNYSSQETIIKNNRVTGEFYDGTISVYGGYCKDVIVDGNIIKGVFDNEPIYLSEGICIDAGCEHTIVVNNNVSGQYYGIDNKNDTRNTLIANNICHGNKVGITDRPGEENKQTFNCEIRNNEITIETLWDTDELGDAMFKSLYYYVGIYTSGRLSGTIQNNKVCLFRKTDSETVCGIVGDAYGVSVNNVYQGPFDISGNTIEFANGYGANSWYAPANSAGFYIGDVQKGTICNNTLKVDTYANKYVMFEFAGANKYLLISNNTYIASSTSSHHFVELGAGATVTDSNVTNNLLTKCVPYFNLEHPSNIVQMPRYDIPAHQIATISLTANTWATVATITPRYAALEHIKVYAIKAASGNKYLMGEYILNIQNDTVTPTTISEEASNLEIQFIHGANTRNCDIQVKATSNVNNFGQLFFSELMGEQDLTIA